MNDRAPAIPIRMDVFRTAIPMRGFEHAAASREVAEAVVVRVEFATGAVGWGETLPRPYVTGETIDSVLADLRDVFWPAMAGRPVRAKDVGLIAARHRDSARRPPVGAPQATGAAPRRRCLNAAACAIELALQNRDSHLFSQDEEIGDCPSFTCRVSGVLGSSDPARTARRLRLMRWFGLRDFKLKLGLADDVDRENLRVVWRRLGGAIRRGTCTLRVDANGAWEADSVPDRVRQLKDFGVCVVEQPIAGPIAGPVAAGPASAGSAVASDSTGRAAALVELAPKCDLPLMADESLVTPDDAAVLLQEPRRIWWNIRISKNGGIGPALALCRLAGEKGVPFVVGCLVGESGILSAAQRRLLEAAPTPRFVEGNYGRFLLADDLTRPSPRFGYGGRLKPLRGAGLGVEVDEGKLRRYGTLVETLTG